MTTSRPRVPRRNDNHMPVLIKNGVTNVNVIHVRHLSSVPLFCRFGKPLVKNTVFNPFPIKTNAQKVDLKNADLKLIRRIHAECEFQGFTICFGFAQKHAKSFLNSEIPIWIFPEQRTLKLR